MRHYLYVLSNTNNICSGQLQNNNTGNNNNNLHLLQLQSNHYSYKYNRTNNKLSCRTALVQ